MMTRTSIASAITGVVFLGAGVVSDGTLLDQTPQSFYAQVKGAIMEYVNPDGYYKQMGGKINDSYRAASADHHITGRGDMGYRLAQRATSSSRSNDHRETQYDSGCYKKECDDTPIVIPDQQHYSQLYRESVADPTFKEALQPQAQSASEGPPPQYVYYPVKEWFHRSQGRIVSLPIEEAYIPPSIIHPEPPIAVNTPNTFLLSILGALSLIALRITNRNK